MVETTEWLPSMWRSPPHPPHPPHRGANPHRMRGRGDLEFDTRFRHMAPQAVTWRRLLPTRSSVVLMTAEGRS